MAIFLSNNKKKKNSVNHAVLLSYLFTKWVKHIYIYIKDVSSWSFKSINESALRFVTVNDYNLKRGKEICTATWVRKQYLNIKYSKQTNLIAYHLFNQCKKKNVRMQIQYNLLQSWKSECSVHLHNWDHKISGLKPLFKKKGDLTQQLNQRFIKPSTQI